jgi:hypothetical protein
MIHFLILILLAIKNDRLLICLSFKSSVLLHNECPFTVKVHLRKEQASTYPPKLPDVRSHDNITFSLLWEDKDWMILENRMLRKNLCMRATTDWECTKRDYYVLRSLWYLLYVFRVHKLNKMAIWKQQAARMEKSQMPIKCSFWNCKCDFITWKI